MSPSVRSSLDATRAEFLDQLVGLAQRRYAWVGKVHPPRDRLPLTTMWSLLVATVNFPFVATENRTL